MTHDKNGAIRIFQPPGERNALGRIRFNFPNKFLVYQHDTPDKKLFALSARAYSHGCMRVQNPDEYAEVLLGISQPEEHYTVAKIRSMYGSTERTINLKHHIPVYITYQTAFTDDAGKVAGARRHLRPRPRHHSTSCIATAATPTPRWRATTTRAASRFMRRRAAPSGAVAGGGGEQRPRLRLFDLPGLHDLGHQRLRRQSAQRLSGGAGSQQDLVIRAVRQFRLRRPTRALAPIAITNSTSSTAYMRGMSKVL